MWCNRYFSRWTWRSAFLISVFAAALLYCAEGQRFLDVSLRVGLKRGLGGRRRKKYGGAAVADLDGDGWQDLLFTHHDDRHTELYFNQRGRFIKSSWAVWNDTHALTPFRFSPRNRNMHFLLSRGGANGNRPLPPAVLQVVSGRRVVNRTKESGINIAIGRSRSAVFMNLRRGSYSYPHVLLTNVPGKGKKGTNSVNQFAFEGISDRKFVRRPIPNFERSSNPLGSVVDVNNDGFVELVSYHDLTIYTVARSFVLRDVSRRVLPPRIFRFGVSAVAELDYDNDGQWDLYVARSNVGELKWLGRSNADSYLLRNVGGRFLDVTKQARVPSIPDARGVTVGDFNNDGWIDIILTRNNNPDLILINNGDGTFTTRNAGFKRAPGIPGDMATAVDYNRDGRLDVVLSEGHFHTVSLGGHYRIMKNISYLRNYLLIRVGSAPNRKATSLHAVATVTAGRLKMKRRVGSPGTAVSISYIELLHFGLGPFTSASTVSVRWINGQTANRYNVKSNRILALGRF